MGGWKAKVVSYEETLLNRFAFPELFLHKTDKINIYMYIKIY